jgi:hypothetical protein
MQSHSISCVRCIDRISLSKWVNRKRYVIDSRFEQKNRRPGIRPWPVTCSPSSPFYIKAKWMEITSPMTLTAISRGIQSLIWCWDDVHLSMEKNRHSSLLLISKWLSYWPSHHLYTLWWVFSFSLSNRLFLFPQPRPVSHNELNAKSNWTFDPSAIIQTQSVCSSFWRLIGHDCIGILTRSSHGFRWTMNGEQRHCELPITIQRYSQCFSACAMQKNK